MDEKLDIVGDKAVPGPLSQELAEWSREFRTRWFRSHKESEFSPGGRTALASMGAFVYLFLAAWHVSRTDPYFGLFLTSDTFQSIGSSFVFLAVLSLAGAAYFLGRLVVFQDSEGGPVRAFLGGVALPAVVVVIAKISLWIF